MNDKLKKPWDALITEDERQMAIERIMTFFAEERDEEIGMVAAGEMLDMFLEEIGPKIFNTGLVEAKEWMKQKMTDLEVDYDMLMK